MFTLSNLTPLMQCRALSGCVPYTLAALRLAPSPHVAFSGDRKDRKTHRSPEQQRIAHAEAELKRKDRQLRNLRAAGRTNLPTAEGEL